MKLIILAGEEHSGKTTILKTLTKTLVANGAILSKSTIVGNPDKDEENELSYCGHKVVICTLGDYPQNLERHCEQNKFADLMICATRTSFGNTNRIALSYDDMSTIILIKPCEDNRQNNEKTVDYLKQVIDIRLNR